MSRFMIGEPVVFDAENRMVKRGSLGRVTSVKEFEGGIWIEAKFGEQSYAMPEGGNIFELHLSELREDRQTALNLLKEMWDSHYFDREKKIKYLSDWEDRVCALIAKAEGKI